MEQGALCWRRKLLCSRVKAAKDLGKMRASFNAGGVSGSTAAVVQLLA